MGIYEIEERYIKVLDEVFEKGRTIHYSKGEVIHRPENDPQGLYRITDGVVKVYSQNAQDQEFIHLYYKQNEIFPISWVGGQEPQNASFMATTDCVVQRITLDEFISHMHDTSDFAYGAFLQVAEQFKIYVNRVANLQYKFASERLAYRLLFVASRLGIHENGVVILPDVSQYDVANSINVSRETVSRQFDKFRQHNLVDMRGKDVVIKDVAGLARELKGGVPPDIWGLITPELQ